MSYLARLKAEISEKRLPTKLTEPTKAPSVSFVSAQGRPSSETEVLPDPRAEARRHRVLAMLDANPAARYAVVTDTTADPEAVVLALAIRGRATCELRIPRAKYDGTLLLDLIERHGATLH